MKVLVNGMNGQLGHDAIKELSKRGNKAIEVGKEQIVLTVSS